jgi:hypothetical protein
MNINDLAAALRACAAGLYPLEAGTELLIANGTFLHRGDFTSRFTKHCTSDGIAMAAIDWDAAATALAAGGLPCSGGERRILQLSASLAGGDSHRPTRHRDRSRWREHRPIAHRNPTRNGKAC